MDELLGMESMTQILFCHPILLGLGWLGNRASVPGNIATQDDPFVFDRIFFGDKDETGLGLGKNIDEALKSGSGISSDPVLGKNIYETLSKDGIITTSHGGNRVKDIYRSDGTATFFEDAADPIYGVKANPPITAAIEDLDFVEKPGKVLPVRLPKMKSGALPLAPTISPSAAPSSSTGRLRRNQPLY